MRHRLVAWALLFGLVACQSTVEEGGSGDPQESIEAAEDQRVDEERLAAMEAKLELMQQTLDGHTKELEALRTHAPSDAPPAPPVPMTGVDCTGFGTPIVHCKLERTLVTALLDDPARLARQARLVPMVKDGETLGFKLYGIRPNSLVKALGFQNGDLIATVDGTPLDSLDAAMRAYDELREREKIVVDVVRRNSPIVLTVEFAK